jgi:hypothetical protein
MLVLGDSVIWGEGLKPEHKSWHQVKLWLEKTTGRTVLERVEAHSGALIEPGPSYSWILGCEAWMDTRSRGGYASILS